MSYNSRPWPEDRYAKAAGLRVRYWVGGHGEDVFLYPGLGGSAEDWASAFTELGEGFRVWALDLPGFGRSDKPARGYSLTFFLKIVKAFMDALGIARAHHVGISMGGGIALALAIESPERVHRLVLVNSALLGRRVHPLLHVCTLPPFGELILRPRPAVVERYIVRCLADPRSAPRDWVAVHQALACLPGAQRAFLAVLRCGMGPFGVKRRVLRPILSALPRLSAETLVVTGEKDRFIPQQYSERAASLIPRAQAVVLPGCAHLPHVERPEIFYPMLARFLRHGLAGLQSLEGQLEGSASPPSAGAHVEPGGDPGSRRRGVKPKQGLEFCGHPESDH